MSPEKPAKRPSSVSPDDWDNVESLRRIRQEKQEKIRRRGSNETDVWASEELIQDSYHIAKRIRELEPPIQIPTERSDGSLRFHPLEVHERALRIANHHRRVVAPLAGGRGTTDLDIAISTVHRRERGLAEHPDFPKEKTRD
ncbi:hypothetical protein K2X83_02745 [Patescibacteria group bacterium]|nr:hypothetical protein [Patescibacteria group bacterium]